MKPTQWTTLLAALLLALSLLAGCGNDSAPLPPDPAPSPAADAGEKDPVIAATEPEPPVQPAAPASADPLPEGSQSAAQPDGGSTATPEPEQSAAEEPPRLEEPSQPSETPGDTSPASQPSPSPTEAPPPEESDNGDAEEPLADGTYTASVTLEGGTGRASVSSPAVLRCEGGKVWATIVWSSPNYDYMKVDGEKYELASTGGNSTFDIPVAAFDQKLDVIADTVAMSEPHEVAYTLYFDSTTLQKQ